MGRRPRTLLLARDPGAANALIPIARSGPAVVVGVGYARRFLELHGVPCRGPANDATHEAIADALAATRPAALLTGTSLRVRRDAGWWSAARSMRIPSVALVDHWTNLAERFTLRRPFDRMPDWIAVIDSSSASGLAERGCPAERIVVTGHPRHDRLMRTGPRGRGVARSLWALRSQDRAVVFAAEPIALDVAHPPFDELDVLRLLLEALKDLGVMLVVRPHPRQAATRLRDVLVGSSVRWSIDTSSTPERVIAGADIVVGIGSQFLVESAIAGLPVLSIQPGRTPLSRLPVGLIDHAGDAVEARAWLTRAIYQRRLDAEARRRRAASAGIIDDAVSRVWSLLRRAAEPLAAT